MDPYWYSPFIGHVKSGCWIFNGIRAPAVFLKNDSIYSYESSNGLFLIHSAGEMDDGSLLVFNDKNRYDFKYYLEDLSNSPQIELKDEIVIIDGNDFKINSPINRIYHLRDSLYLYDEDPAGLLMLASFSNNQIKLIKRLKPAGEYITISGLTGWRIFNNNLFYLKDNKLVRETYNNDSVSFVNKQIVTDTIGKNYNFSYDNRFFAQIINDSLLVYSLSRSKLVNSYALNFIQYKWNPFIDSPYVYLHQIKTVTDVNDSQKLPDRFVLYQNYPNPFNPSTTIQYELPQNSQVEIQVYDLLGREITTIVNNEQNAGRHKIEFSGGKLNSGIYFYRLKANNYLEVKKMLLVK